MAEYYGRKCLMAKVHAVPEHVTPMPAIIDGVCQRCFCKLRGEWCLPHGAVYCWHCHQLGRVSSLDQFWWQPEPHAFIVEQHPCQWRGNLSVAQTRVANQLVESYQGHQSRLVYAVTGAGKTEMLYPLLNMALKDGKRVAIVSPRVDVLLEISRRMREAFVVSSVLLYGDSPEVYRYTQLVFATTHQLLHFWRAFDVLVVDEVDAFPYAENPVLARTVTGALLERGSVIYLTATPSQRLLRACRHAEMQLSVLPRRFHGYLLPQLTIKIATNWRKQLPHALVKILRQYQTSGQRFLLFVPEIADLPIMKALVAPYCLVETVHAQTKNRRAIVQAMRDEKVQGLITTTILERGVTFAGIDVIIMGADESTFSTAAILQMAGRCGRSKERPGGLVMCIVTEKNGQVKQAYHEIAYLNRMAVKDAV
ncbi:MAG: DEAD/DEAH box helicase [Lactobacillaceae bacterium]|jgi:competence protein ComFA|nr:DEAD/DEAH box helicase [Lactobacillaceae bacterium]